MTDRKIYPPLAARRPVRCPSLRSSAPARRRTMPIMSHREPLLVKNLTHKAERTGYHPQVILAGRRINDGMAKFVADKTARMIALAGKAVRGAKVNLLGLTFKENVTDLRNSKVAELRAALAAQGARVHVHDPIADPRQAKHEYGIELEEWSALPQADALILAVAHRGYRERSTEEFLGKLAPGGCVLDVKGVLDLDALRRAGCACWRL